MRSRPGPRDHCGARGEGGRFRSLTDGTRARGRTQIEHEKIVADGQAVQAAGAFAVVIEGVVEPIAVALTQSLEIPTIGIGASSQCDGQVLVTEDMLGMFERVPRFVKRYGSIAETITAPTLNAVSEGGHWAASSQARASQWRSAAAASGPAPGAVGS